MQDEKIDEIQINVQTVNQNKEPISFIQQYAVYEHLGSGAFGSVYKVKKVSNMEWSEIFIVINVQVREMIL